MNFSIISLIILHRYKSRFCGDVIEPALTCNFISGVNLSISGSDAHQATSRLAADSINCILFAKKPAPMAGKCFERGRLTI